MPVILRVKGYRFWFYEADMDEPAHVYVGKEKYEAKFWLEPVGVARVSGLKPVDMREIERIIKENLNFLLNAWKKEQNKRANS